MDARSNATASDSTGSTDHTGSSNSCSTAHPHNLRDKASMDPHNRFLAFLTTAQRCRVDIILTTWQPGMDSLGAGATGLISQSNVNRQTKFVFKRPSFQRRAGDESQQAKQEAFVAASSEVSVLTHPSIRGHENIVNLHGICWEITGSGDDEQVWPVLVFDKAPLGDLSQFMQSNKGRALGVRERLDLAIGAGKALEAMHSCNIIHGDVKPKNVLVFEDDRGRPVPRLTDFGYSTVAASEGDLISMPFSKNWTAPLEPEDSEVRLPKAKKMDVFSLGMVCLWLLFGERFLERRDFYRRRTAGGPAGHDALLELDPTMETSLLGRLTSFFTDTLAVTKNRTAEVRDALPFLLAAQDEDASSERPALESAAAASIQSSAQLLPHVEYVLLAHLTLLYRGDFRVRRHLVRSLKEQCFLECEKCVSNSMFQLAMCYLTGFGTPRSCDYADLCLAASGKQPEAAAPDAALRALQDVHTTSQVQSLMSDAYFNQLEYVKRYESWGLFDEAKAVIGREAKDLGVIIGQSHVIVMDLKMTLANILAAEKDHEASNALRMEVRAQLAERVGDDKDSPKFQFMLTLDHNIGASLFAMGRHPDAMVYIRRAYEGRRESLGKDHLETLASQVALGQLLHTMGDLAGKKHELAARTKRRELLGESHPDSLLDSVFMAGDFEDKNDYAAAEKVLRKTLDLSRSSITENDPVYFQMWYRQAMLLRSMGRYDEADTLHRDLLKTMEKSVGPDDVDLIQYQYGYASQLRHQGCYEESEAMARQVLSAMERVGSKKFPRQLRANALNALALAMADKARFGEAEQLLMQALRENDTGGSFYDSGLFEANLASVRYEMGRREESETTWRRLLAESRDRLGRGNRLASVTARNLGRALSEQKKYRSALEMYVEAWEGMLGIFGADHPSTKASEASVLSTLHSLLENGTSIEECMEALGAMGSKVLELMAATEAGKAGERTRGKPAVESERAWLGAPVARGYAPVPLHEIKYGRLEVNNADPEFGDMRQLLDPKAPSELHRLGAGGTTAASPRDFVVSDVDEQLLMWIEFKRPTAVHSIHLTSFPWTNLDGENSLRPRTVMLYVNRKIVDFDAAEKTKESLKTELSESNWKHGTAVIETTENFVKFQGVSTLVIFVIDGLESRPDGSLHGQFTRLDRIRVVGKAVAAHTSLHEGLHKMRVD